MKPRLFILIWLLVNSTTICLVAQLSLDTLIDKEIASLVTDYQMLHAAPELSRYEEKTSAFLARELRKLGYTVTEHVGRYDRPQSISYGVVGIMPNGNGPTVLLRADMDALPVEEKTGLPYASRVKTKNDAGETVPVMHACGHDIHVTTLLGAAKILPQLKDYWHGTLVLVGQPAEETVEGARAMLNDGLYTRFPKPDYAFALHDAGDMEAGQIGYSPGYSLASSTAVEIIVRGLGGHGSRPEATKDPIVVTAQIILALQTIVSRENSPLDPAVVTVGSIHGGSKNNIIPDEVRLQLTVRAYKEEVRQKLLAAIRRISRHTALSAGIPEDHSPIVTVTEGTPATYNDPVLTQRLALAMGKTLGTENVIKINPVMGSEDFTRYSLEGRTIPISLFWLGAGDPAKVAQSRQSGIPLPSLHSSLFAPLPEPTLRTGIKAMTSVVLELMK